MSRPLALTLATLTLASADAAAIAAPGDLDRSFSRNGIAALARSEQARAIAVQANGSIVVAGRLAKDGRSGAFFARYNRNGERDRDFGFNGTTTVGVQSGGSNSANGAVARDLVVYSDDSLRSAGSVAGEPAVIGLKSNGELDPTFGSGGVAPVDLGAASVATDLAIDAVGRTVVIGAGTAARLLADGRPDPSFGQGGSQQLPIDGSALELGEDGSVLIAGSWQPPAGVPRTAVIRLVADGSIDQSFGEGGIAVGGLAGDTVRANSIASTAEGGIFVGAWERTRDLGPGPVYVRRDAVIAFTASGELDTAYRDGGLLSSVTGPIVAADRQDHLLVAGAELPGPGFDSTYAVARHARGGALNRAFGLDGRAFAYDNLQGGTAIDLALSPRGTLAVLGDGSRDVLIGLRRQGGRLDTDADGISDRRDQCPVLLARADGCPRVPRRLSLRRRGPHRLIGTLSAPVSGCVQDERIAVFEPRRGRDRTVVRLRQSDRRGVFRVTENLGRRGRYYAVSKAHFEPPFGHCESARSRAAVLR